MDYKMIRLEQTEEIAVITLDYAPTLNALDMNMSLELEDALKKAETAPDVKVVVITGAGRAFCGGGDIRYMKAHCEEPDFAKESMGPLAKKLSEIALYIKKLSKGPALAYRNMKKLMFESMYKDFETFMAAEEIYLGQCSSSEDFKEGITAFLEKRPADFKGK